MAYDKQQTELFDFKSVKMGKEESYGKEQLEGHPIIEPSPGNAQEPHLDTKILICKDCKGTDILEHSKYGRNIKICRKCRGMDIETKIDVGTNESK